MALSWHHLHIYADPRLSTPRGSGWLPTGVVLQFQRERYTVKMLLICGWKPLSRRNGIKHVEWPSPTMPVERCNRFVVPWWDGNENHLV